MTTTINGRYLLHETLGQGGMGIVHRAMDRLTGDVVALKQVILQTQPDLFSSDPLDWTNNNLRLALAHEFQTLASLRHPHIISVLDYGFDDRHGQPFYTMSFLGGASDILSAAAGLGLTDRIDLLRQMLQALTYLHRRGILHRDLKPANVLVMDNAVRVLDFGLAAAKEEATLSVGTWAYTAPEVLEENPATDASDLYSVGIIAYQIFAGRHPFDLGAHDFIDQVLDRPPDLSQLAADRELSAVIGRLLEKNPADRYGSAAAAIAAFSEAAGQPLPAEDVAIRESFLQAATFVGRERELALLDEALAQAKAGAGSGWLVGGESGVGKSRLLDEVRIQALVSGALVLRGQSVEDGAGPPYQLWRDAVRRLVITAQLDDLAIGVLQAIVPDIGPLLDREVPPIPPLEGQAGRQRLISTIVNLFRQSHQWMLLLLEDLQWSAESLDVLRQLSRLTTELPLLIVGNYRNDEMVDLPETLPLMNPISLERLAAPDIKALSASMLGDAGLQPRVLDLLQRETEGNAFFLVEVVRELAEEAGRLSAIGEMALPAQIFPRGIETIVQRRLARVPVRARILLPGAAAAGRQLDLQLIGYLAEQGEDEINLEHWLTVCADAAVFDVYDGLWRFAHEKLREGIMGTLTAMERAGWHERVALALESLYPNDPEYASALVFHWHQVGRREKERAYARIAGNYARRQFLNKEAITYLSRALELTPDDALIERFELLLAREQVLSLQGEREAQDEDLRLLEELAAEIAELGVGERRAEVALRQANFAEATGDYPAAVTAAREAISLAQMTTDQLNEAEGYIAWGRALVRLGQLEEAQQKFGQGLTQARQASLLQAEADSLRWLGVVATDLGHFRDAEAFYQQALPLYRSIDDRQGESSVLNNLGNIARAQGRYGPALASWEAAQRRSQEIGDREGNGRLLINLTAVWLDLGDYERARRYGEPALQILREIGHRLGECFALVNLGLLYFYEGQDEEAESVSRAALELADEIGARFMRGMALMNLGHSLFSQYRLDEAAAVYKEALALWESLAQHAFVMSARAGLAMVDLEDGDVARALSQVEHILSALADGHDLQGIERPLRVYLICHRVLALAGDPRAQQVLADGHAQLQELAGVIDDAEQRQIFLGVDVRRELHAAFLAQTDR